MIEHHDPNEPRSIRTAAVARKFGPNPECGTLLHSLGHTEPAIPVRGPVSAADEFRSVRKCPDPPSAGRFRRLGHCFGVTVIPANGVNSNNLPDRDNNRLVLDLRRYA